MCFGDPIHGAAYDLSPEREQPVEVEAPIEYTTLQPSHLDQVHDLLGRAFWTGIDGELSRLFAPLSH